jgi:hypothetical protein
MKQIIAVIVAAIALAGCARTQTEIAAQGGFFASHDAPYVVRNDSGGRIMDVWVLENTFVMEGEHGAGFQFVDSAGNVVHLGGDARIIRLKDAAALSRWHEYHAESEQLTYEALYAQR